jgi:hypothetical protein
MAKKENNRGFGTLGVLLTVLVIAIVGAGGWYVFYKNKTPHSNNGKDTADSQQDDTSNNGGSVEATYLTVEELGVRLKLGDSIKDAYYKVKNSNKNGKPVIALYLHSWDVYKNCTPENNSNGLGAISTFTPGESDAVNGDMATSYPDAPLIDGLHYYIAQAQSDCSAGSATDRQAVREAFTTAYKTIEKE